MGPGWQYRQGPMVVRGHGPFKDRMHFAELANLHLRVVISRHGRQIFDSFRGSTGTPEGTKSAA